MMMMMMMPDLPIYCWWFNYTLSNTIGPAPVPVIQNLNVKTVAKVDELLACQASPTQDQGGRGHALISLFMVNLLL